MGRVTFDTLTYTKILREGGFSESQAKVLAKAQSEAFEQMIDNSDLATKGDIARLDNHIVQLEKQMAEMELRLTKSFQNAIYGFAGVVIAAVACAVAILK